MFWGITLENGKRYSQTVDKPFHLSMAALEYNEKDAAKNKAVSVMIEHKESQFLLCSLQHGKCAQQPLDLNFIEKEEITFFILGLGTVHLTGYLVNEDMIGNLDFNDMTDDEEEKNEEETSKQSIEKGLKRKKSESLTKQIEKVKTDDDESSDESDTEIKKFYNDLANKESHKKNASSSPTKSPQKEMHPSQTKFPKQPTPSSTKTNQKKNKELETKEKYKAEIIRMDISKDDDKNEMAVANGMNETPMSPSKKKRNKKKRKRHSEGNADETLSQTPAEKTPRKDVQKLQGGTVVEDIQIGNGPLAKKGNSVQIKYVGKLTNNKVFDSSKDSTLKFRLGKGEVIKGMELGIEGMKVGGKRKITIPPHQGYGKTVQGPIPPNSTLIFEVELKSVK